MRVPDSRLYEEVRMRIGGVIISLWLIIGLIAVAQRGYFGHSADNCASAGTSAVTIIAGPLNYLGLNPKVTCQ
jgi:hypothetical protein